MTEELTQKEGYIFDYISVQEIKSTPEEIDAVQPFSIQLVEDYGYSKEVIQTRPQFRVKARPSDTTKQYPVDIAIFKDKNLKDDEVYIIVECKKKTRKDGKTQLEDYLRLSKAELGVWFNGEERLFIKKIEKGVKQQKEVNMAVLEEIGHNHQGKEIYRWDLETKSIDRSELWDDTPLVIDEIKTGFKKYCFKVDFNKTLAEKENLQLIPIKELISKKILKCFDGHGSPPAEYKGR